MARILKTLLALTAGAAAMYYLDPQLGRRRRHETRDRALAASRDARDYAQHQVHHAAGRVRGMVATARMQVGLADPQSDEQLLERIRARLGRVVSRAAAIDIQVEQSCVRLSGDILASDVQPLIAAISAQPGVDSIENALTVHETPEQMPAHQARHEPAALPAPSV